ncbi:MAG: esterase/lipase family protein [Actinomycetota bacterium]
MLEKPRATDVHKAWRGALASLLVLILSLSAVPAMAEGDSPLSAPQSALDGALACPSSFDHPNHEPVLLVHGLGSTGEENWGWNYASTLPALGYDVCTIDIPGRGWGDMQVSAEYVVHAVRRIAAVSGRQVDIMGHSQGGVEPRWVLRWWPRTRELVDDLVTLGTPHHGLADPGAGDMGCPLPCAPPADWQFRDSARFLRALNSVDETPGRVSYTSIWSRNDELVQTLALGRPTSELDGASNVAIQDLCAGRGVSHVGLAADAVAFSLVMDALAHAGPTDVTRFDRSTCSELMMPGVSLPASGDPVGWLTAPATAPRVAEEPPLASYATDGEPQRLPQ